MAPRVTGDELQSSTNNAGWWDYPLPQLMINHGERKMETGTLVVSRYPGEAVIIDGNIIVRAEVNQNGSVKIAITAPIDISIDREEVHERKLRESK